MNSELIWTRLMQLFRLLFILFILTVAYFVILYVTPLLFPFIISLIIAFIINRPVDFLQKKGRMPRWLAVLVVLLLFLAFFVTIAVFLVIKVIAEVSNLIEMLPTYAEQLQTYFTELLQNDFFQRIYDRFSYFYNSLDPQYQNQISNSFNDGLENLLGGSGQLVSPFLTGVKNFFFSLPGLATIFIISLLATFFISKDFYKLKEKARVLLPLKAHSRIRKIYEDLRHALFGFIKAQLTLISITGAIVIIGLLILRVEYAITIGLLTGLVDLLPYLGTGAVFVPWIIYLFFSKNYFMVIGLSILYAVVLIQRQIMEPKVLADNVGLDPLVTLIALFVGLKLFGFLGLIIGPVSIVVFKSFYSANLFQDTWKYIKTGEFT